MPLESSDSNKSIPPPFTELAMPSAEHYYDLSDPEVVMETFPEHRELFTYILERSETRAKAALVMRRQVELEGKTIVTESEVKDLRKKFRFVSALNLRSEREGNDYLRTLQHI